MLERRKVEAQEVDLHSQPPLDLQLQVGAFTTVFVNVCMCILLLSLNDWGCIEKMWLGRGKPEWGG